MQFPESIQAALKAAQMFLISNGASLEEAMRDKLIDALAETSAVVSIVNAGEALYAARAELDEAGKMLCAQLIGFAAAQGWHGLDTDNRGGRIVQAMLRDLGEVSPTGQWPDPESDPAPDSRFAAVAPGEDVARGTDIATPAVEFTQEGE